MPVRVFLSRTMEPLDAVAAETEIRHLETRMLPREDERRLQPALGEGARNRSQFDRLGPGADHQPDVKIQPSP
jgi:hypothetical protein